MSSRLALALSASALVVALLGSTPLGHAIASQVPRNSVGPLQLKRNAVTARKLSPNAVRTAHVLDGTLLAADFKAGQIPAGPKGDAGPPGVSERQIVLSQGDLNSNPAKNRQAFCPEGKTAIGGGGNITPFGVSVAISRSVPLSNSWDVAAIETTATNTNWRITTYVVCAKVT
jgi:hypothetical protein